MTYPQPSKVAKFAGTPDPRLRIPRGTLRGHSRDVAGRCFNRLDEDITRPVLDRCRRHTWKTVRDVGDVNRPQADTQARAFSLQVTFLERPVLEEESPSLSWRCRLQLPDLSATKKPPCEFQWINLPLLLNVNSHVPPERGRTNNLRP